MAGLEAVLICADNSEWMRNGDYSPTRLEAQTETINYLASAKVNGHPDTTCGILSMAGHRVTVHSSPVRGLGQLMTCIKDLECFGKCDLLGALKTAQLALKNRQNKSQKQRIIVFIGSPVDAETKVLVKLGKQLKKNNISVDVINFGAENASNENTEKLEAFVNATNSSDTSHLLTIPPGPHILSGLVLSSAIMGGSGQQSGFGGGASGGFSAGDPDLGGIDPNMEPDLAMAIRMSMEEERARQQRAAGGGADAPTGADASAAPATPAPAATGGDDAVMEEDEDEEALLAQAIAMSMAMHRAETAGGAAKEEGGKDVEMVVDGGGKAEAAAAADAAMDEDDEDFAAALEDPDFINSLLDSTGVGAEEFGGLDDILNKIMADDEKEEDKAAEDKKKEGGEQDKDKPKGGG